MLLYRNASRAQNCTGVASAPRVRIHARDMGVNIITTIATVRNAATIKPVTHLRTSRCEVSADRLPGLRFLGLTHNRHPRRAFFMSAQAVPSIYSTVAFSRSPDDRGRKSRRVYLLRRPLTVGARRRAHVIPAHGNKSIFRVDDAVSHRKRHAQFLRGWFYGGPYFYRSFFRSKIGPAAFLDAGSFEPNFFPRSVRK